MLLRLVEPIEEALLLLLPGYIQKELENDRPLPGQVFLEVGNVGETLVPDALAHARRGQLLALEDIGVHADHEDFLVVRAIEDADTAAFGQGLHVPPQKVMVE